MQANIESNTQQGYAWAKEVDENQERTVGIITKPDLVEDAHHADFPQKLKGIGKAAYSFKLGVDVVRNRTAKELEENATYEQVALKEKHFFDGHPTLSKMDKIEKQEMLGGEALVNKLVRLQTERIRASIPGLVAQITQRLLEEEAKLAKLPPACSTVSECRHFFMQCVSKIDRDISQQWQMDHSAIDDFAIVRAEKAGYAAKLAAAAAATAAAEKAQAERDASEQAAAQAIVDAHSSGMLSPLSTASGWGANSSPAATPTPVPAVAKPTAPQAEQLPDFRSSKQLRMLPRLQDLFDTFSNAVGRGGRHLFSKMYRETIRSVVHEARGKSLPDTIPHAVIDKLVKEEVNKLRGPAEQLIKQAAEYMRAFMKLLVDERFGAYVGLRDQVLRSITQLLDSKEAMTLEFVEEQIKVELDPNTQNHYYTETLNHLREAIEKEKMRLQREQDAGTVTEEADDEPQFDQMTAEEAAAFVAAIERGQPESFRSYLRQIALLSRADNETQSLIETQCRLYSYRKVVFKRFVDVVCQRVRLHFPRHLEESLQEYLQRQFLDDRDNGSEFRGGGDDDDDSEPGSDAGGEGNDDEERGRASAQPYHKLVMLMQEPELQRRQREALNTSIAKLRKALRLLDKSGLATGAIHVRGSGRRRDGGR